MAKQVYRLLGMLISFGGGLLATAIFAVVTSTLERLAAQGTRSLTGTWPGKDSDGNTSGESGGINGKKA
jgi:hypothetical protein